MSARIKSRKGLDKKIMVKEASAGGRDFREVVPELRGNETRSFEVVFFYDGDETVGEYNLQHWDQAKKTLKNYPDIDDLTLQINDTHLAGREGIVLSFLLDPEWIVVKPSPVPVEAASKAVSEKACEEPDLWEGKRFNVTARKKGNIGKPITFVLVVDNPEQRIDDARRLVWVKMHTHPDNVDITVREVDKDFVYRKAMADLRAGHFVDKKIVDSDVRISREVTRQKLRKMRDYR